MGLSSSFYQNRKVLITGGAGFIGSNLAIKLVEAGAHVSVLDGLIPELGGNVYNLESVRKKIHFEQCDLRDWSRVPHLIKDFEIVFNLAGNISHIDSMHNPIMDMTLNVNTQVNTLEACRKNCPDAIIVYSSTRQFYGIPQYLPVDEKHPIIPVDVNGINKYTAEQYHSLYFRNYNMKTISLRLTNTYGPRQLIRHSRQGVIGWFLNRALTGSTVELFGGGTQKRDITYVDDVCSAFMLAAQTQQCIGKAYNLGGFQTTLKEIAEQFIKYSGKGETKGTEFPAEKKKIDIGDYVADYSLFKNATGWTPTVKPEDGLARMVDYYSKNAKHYL